MLTAVDVSLVVNVSMFCARRQSGRESALPTTGMPAPKSRQNTRTKPQTQLELQSHSWLSVAIQQLPSLQPAVMPICNSTGRSMQPLFLPVLPGGDAWQGKPYPADGPAKLSCSLISCHTAHLPHGRHAHFPSAACFRSAATPGTAEAFPGCDNTAAVAASAQKP